MNCYVAARVLVKQPLDTQKTRKFRLFFFVVRGERQREAEGDAGEERGNRFLSRALGDAKNGDRTTILTSAVAMIYLGH